LADELLLPEGVSVEALQKLFDENFMDTAIDSDGELIVSDTFRCYLRPDPDGRLILVYAVFGAAEGAQDADKLAYANRVNDQVKLIRASVAASGRFSFEYYFPVEGGVSKQALVLAVRRFFRCLNKAFDQDLANVVA
jgi:hypothetical protein